VKKHVNHFVTSFIDWLFRRRHPATILVRGGLSLLLLLIAGWTVSFSMSTEYGPFLFEFDSEGGRPTLISYGLFGLVVGLCIFGFIWYRADQRRLSRKKVIVVEARGLRDTSGTPLHEAVPEELEGHRDKVLIDLHQRVKDGAIIEPNVALQKLASLPTDLERRENGFDRSDITCVYGGLAPVPLTFLTGVLMDDEGSVIVMDWNRHAENWRLLDGQDDGERFLISGLDTVPADAPDVALTISVSYSVDISGVRQKVSDIPLVKIELPSGSPDCHWSEDKQRALGQEFLDIAIELGNRGTKQVHLFLAAQNSVVFRFGRLYDKRNLPEVTVYQYQRENTPPYPWGIRMPVCGRNEAEIFY
jgi:hypothetical protein